MKSIYAFTKKHQLFTMICEGLLIVIVIGAFDLPSTKNNALDQIPHIEQYVKQATKKTPLHTSTTYLPTSTSTTSTTTTTTQVKKTSIPKTTVAVTPAPQSSVNTLTPTSSGSGGSQTNSSGGQPSNISYSSTNWAGYLATTGTFTSISGSWTIPHVTGNGSTESADAAWIGIGGVTSIDLIQIGTLEDVSASGNVTYLPFFEMLPSQAQVVPEVAVTGGDSITASVSEAASNIWTFSIVDHTNGQSWTHNVDYASTNSSAEWIEEDPSFAGGSLAPLDNFGSTTFSGGSTTDNGSSINIYNASSSKVTLVNSSGQPLATTSNITSDGGGFTVTQN
jgi:hypothetical protein